MEPIDLTKPPLTIKEIERLQAENTTDIVQQHDRTLLLNILALIPTFLVSGVLVWFSLSTFRNENYTLSATLSLLSCVGFLGAMLLEQNIRALWAKSHRLEQKIRSTKKALREAKPETCLEIKSWLDDPIIRTYQDGVNAQGRTLINAEVEAMRDYYNGREEREAREKKQAEVEAACRAVYGV